MRSKPTISEVQLREGSVIQAINSAVITRNGW